MAKKLCVVCHERPAYQESNVNCTWCDVCDAAGPMGTLDAVDWVSTRARAYERKRWVKMLGRAAYGLITIQRHRRP